VVEVWTDTDVQIPKTSQHPDMSNIAKHAINILIILISPSLLLLQLAAIIVPLRSLHDGV
jgi:hypothetical protein